MVLCPQRCSVWLLEQTGNLVVSNYTEDEKRSAISEYERLAKIADNARGKAANGAEKAKGLAYQKLVRMGLRMQLKAKYRG